MMFFFSKIQLLIPALIALLLVVFDPKLVLCLDSDGKQQATDSSTPLYNQVRYLKSKESKKDNIKGKSKSNKDSKQGTKKRWVYAAKHGEERDETATSLRGSFAPSSLVGEGDPIEHVEEDTTVEGRQSVTRPSSILGREPTPAPIPASEENKGVFLRPGSSYFADESPYPTQPSRNQQNNPLIQDYLSRPGGSSTTSFTYPTVAPTYSPVDRQINPETIPINYVPRPGTTSSWLDDGSQSYEANRPTPVPTPIPTTFPPVAVPGLNIPVGRPISVLLPESPSYSPTNVPSKVPSNFPTLPPTRPPTRSPTLPPTRAPTNKPTTRPTRRPTRPTYPPTWFPTLFPSISPEPSVKPSGRPTISPSRSPSGEPSESPSDRPSGRPSSFSGTLKRPGSVSSFSTRSPTFFPTMVDTVDTTGNSTNNNTTDNGTEEIPQSTSSPVSIPTSASPTVSMQQTTANVPLNPLQQIAGQTFPTWAPTTFMPTVTFSPTKFIDWTAGQGGRSEPDLSPSAIDESAPPINGQSEATDVPLGAN